MCTFDNGSGSSTLNQLVKQAWARGSLIQMDMHLPNPYDNWQNNPIQPSVPPPRFVLALALVPPRAYPGIVRPTATWTPTPPADDAIWYDAQRSVELDAR